MKEESFSMWEGKEHSKEPRWRAKADVGKRQKLIIAQRL